MNPFDWSQRCVCTCAVAPALSGRFVKKMISHRRSAASAASFLTTPGSISASPSQKFSTVSMCRHNRRSCRDDIWSLAGGGMLSGREAAASSGSTSGGGASALSSSRRATPLPNSVSASRRSPASMSARTPSRSHPIRKGMGGVRRRRREERLDRPLETIGDRGADPEAAVLPLSDV